MVENKDTSIPDYTLFWTGERFDSKKGFKTYDIQQALAEFKKACQYYQKFFSKKQADILLESSNNNQKSKTIDFMCFRMK